MKLLFPSALKDGATARVTARIAVQGMKLKEKSTPEQHRQETERIGTAEMADIPDGA
jgi:hypothetical protein